jgi:GNAT superfamily N-acetyltransferase
MAAPARRRRHVATLGREAEARSQPPQRLEVRPARHVDVSAIATMQKASLPENSRAVGRRRIRGRRERRALLRGALVQIDRCHSRRRTRRCGSAHRWAARPHLGEPSLRSKSIGWVLIEAVERQAALESSELTLEVWEVNRRAVEFYKRLGFSVSGSVADPVTNLEKLVMRKTLRPI